MKSVQFSQYADIAAMLRQGARRNAGYARRPFRDIARVVKFGEKTFEEDDMTRATGTWDAADSLETKEDIAAYLDAVLEDGDPDLLKAALGDIARARGMTEIAQAAGLGRANLYKALSPDGNPEFATVARVLKALGLRLSVAA